MMQNFLWMIRKEAFTPQTWSTERTNYVVKCLIQGNALENWTSGSHGRYSSTQWSQRVSSPHPQGTEAADLSGCTQDKFGGIPSTLGHMWTAALLTFAGSCYPARKKKLGPTHTDLNTSHGVRCSSEARPQPTRMSGCSCMLTRTLQQRTMEQFSVRHQHLAGLMIEQHQKFAQKLVKLLQFSCKQTIS